MCIETVSYHDSDGLFLMSLLVLFLEPHSECNSMTIFFTYETDPAFVVERVT